MYSDIYNVQCTTYNKSRFHRKLQMGPSEILLYFTLSDYILYKYLYF